MKKLLMILSLALGLSVFHKTHADSPTSTPGITLEEALTIAQNEFPGQDYDYYLVEDDDDGVWTIFIDSNRFAFWAHDCWIIKVSKTFRVNVDPSKPMSKVRKTSPPKEDFSPLFLTERPELNNIEPMSIDVPVLSEKANEDAKRTYALIINGGNKAEYNYFYFWWDCANIYRVLTRVYGVPKDNIFPIMADGTNKAKDHRDFQGIYRSQSLDLDNDGQNEIKLSATTENIQTTLNAIYSKIKEGDQLFIFVTDHGESDGNNVSYIYLWNGKKLYDYKLAQMLVPFTNKKVIVNTVLGQCKSGGFIDDLSKAGCVVTTSCAGNENGWYLGGYNTEFLRCWIEAVNYSYSSGFYGDLDKDGRVTMKEAFNYATAHLSNPPDKIQHPQYSSIPATLGEDLSFDYLPSSTDLYIKDNVEDAGHEPNITTEIFFESPSIWVRNQKDDVQKHENPVFSQSHKKAYIYVNVENRGWEDYTSGQWLHVYCSKASTGLTKAAWKGDEIYSEDGQATGMHLTPVQIPAIPAGSSKILEVEWNLPEELLAGIESNGSEKHHFCILARVVPDSEDNFDSTGDFDVLADNNMAQKNVSIVSYKDLVQNTRVFVRNISNDIHNYSLELKPRTTLDAGIYNIANIELSMPYTLYSSWQAGGCETTGMEQPCDPSDFEEADPAQVQAIFTLSSPESAINSICMDAAQLDPVTLKFDFHDTPALSMNYTLDLIQRDESGKIVGGETFYVESPQNIAQPIDTIIGIDPIPFPGGIALSAKAPENSKLTWFDGNNRKLGESSTLKVSAAKEGETYKLTALNEEGELAKAEITLENISAIRSISLDASRSLLDLELASPAPEGAEIKVTSILEGEMKLTKTVTTGESRLSIDVSTLAIGHYAVSYIVNNQVIDSEKINK